MEKQAAGAAAISSSGLVASGLSSERFGQLTFCSPSLPLVVERIVPLPSIRLPCHVTSARRSVAIKSPSVGKREAYALRSGRGPRAELARSASDGRTSVRGCDEVAPPH